MEETSDAPLLQVFASAHPGLVALHTYVGAIGALVIYSMPKLQGATFVEALNTL